MTASAARHACNARPGTLALPSPLESVMNPTAPIAIWPEDERDRKR
ncbi:MAG: hypothetical protein KUL80_02060 [Comamonas sp.]|nr:hypothetical protein [Comamonas sp.]